MESIRFGILGAARIANKFCDAAQKAEGAKVIAVASKDLERAKTFAQKNQIADYYDSYDEMLSREDIDAVYIATTHNFHYENLLECIRHGKHVLCEKSMVPTAQQARTVFELARQRGVFVMEAMWSRFLPCVQKAKQWLDEGRIGTVSLVNASLGFAAEYDPNGRMFNPKLGGGALYDLGVYNIEVTSWLVGKPILETSSKILYADTGVDKTDAVTLVFDGCIAALQSSICSKVAEGAFLYGTKGYIELPRFHFGDECRLYDTQGNLVERFAEKQENGFVYEIEETVHCIRAGKLESSVMPHSDTIRCAEIFEKCFKENR